MLFIGPIKKKLINYKIDDSERAFGEIYKGR